MTIVAIALAFFDWNWLRAPLASSLALGALNPLAALLPLIDTGGNKDADCRGLMQEAKENVQARSTAPARGATPSCRPSASASQDD